MPVGVSCYFSPPSQEPVPTSLNGKQPPPTESQKPAVRYPTQAEGLNTGLLSPPPPYSGPAGETGGRPQSDHGYSELRLATPSPLHSTGLPRYSPSALHTAGAQPGMQASLLQRVSAWNPGSLGYLSGVSGFLLVISLD